MFAHPDALSIVAQTGGKEGFDTALSAAAAGSSLVLESLGSRPCSATRDPIQSDTDDAGERRMGGGGIRPTPSSLLVMC